MLRDNAQRYNFKSKREENSKTKVQYSVRSSFLNNIRARNTRETNHGHHVKQRKPTNKVSPTTLG